MEVIISDYEGHSMTLKTTEVRIYTMEGHYALLQSHSRSSIDLLVPSCLVPTTKYLF